MYSFNKTFQIQNTYLYLSTVSELDAESRSNYLLNLTAVDSGETPLKGEAEGGRVSAILKGKGKVPAYIHVHMCVIRGFFMPFFNFLNHVLHFWPIGCL